MKHQYWGLVFLLPFFVAGFATLVYLARMFLVSWRWKQRQARLKRAVWGKR